MGLNSTYYICEFCRHEKFERPSNKVGGGNFEDIHLSDQMCKLVCTSLNTSSSKHFLLSVGRSSFICRAESCKQRIHKGKLFDTAVTSSSQ